MGQSNGQKLGSEVKQAARGRMATHRLKPQPGRWRLLLSEQYGLLGQRPAWVDACGALA